MVSQSQFLLYLLINSLPRDRPLFHNQLLHFLSLFSMIAGPICWKGHMLVMFLPKALSPPGRMITVSNLGALNKLYLNTFLIQTSNPFG